MIILFIILFCFVSTFIYLGISFSPRLNAIKSVKKIKENLYSMEFVGDYGFDLMLKNGGVTNTTELANHITYFLSNGFYKQQVQEVNQDFGCSTLSAIQDDNNFIFGRNYDWYDDCQTMIIHTKPKNGYESISTCCLNFLGFGDEWKPEGFVNSLMAIASIYVPLDGMNEKGLTIADLMAGDDEVTKQDSQKPNITTTTAIRLILDKAATVDEAIDLLKQYDMNSDIGTAHHLSISDATGKSVVVEYCDNKMFVKETKVVTNHYLTDCNKPKDKEEQTYDRFNKLSELNGTFDEEKMKNALESVSQKNYIGSESKTIWSLVYNQNQQNLYANFYWQIGRAHV